MSFRVANSDEFFVKYQSDGEPIVYFTRQYTEEILRANWYPNREVPPEFGEAIKREGGSWSWDLRILYSQYTHVPQQQPPQRINIYPGGSPIREATYEEFIVLPQPADGNVIVYFTKEYTEEVLHGDWYPSPSNPNVPQQFGEAIKKEGGSYSWDLRLQYDEKQRNRYVQDTVFSDNDGTDLYLMM
jgi:hypothetical protein